MNNEHPTSDDVTSAKRSGARAGLIGAAVALTAAVGALVLVPGGAGAASDDRPEIADTGIVATADAETDVETYANAEAELDGYVCVEEFVLDELDGEIPFDELEGEIPFDELEGEIPFEDLEDCEELTEAELAELDEAFAAYDQCLVDNGFDTAAFEEWDEAIAIDEPTSMVLVETPEGATFVDLGDGEGTITVTFDGDDVEVDVDGDATAESVVWDELDAVVDHEAFDACDDLFPEAFDIEADQAAAIEETD